MFGKKKLLKRIEELESKYQMLLDRSFIKVWENEVSVYTHPMAGSIPYYKSSNVPLDEVVGMIMTNLGLKLEYKAGKPSRPEIKDGAIMVWNKEASDERSK